MGKQLLFVCLLAAMLTRSLAALCDGITLTYTSRPIQKGNPAYFSDANKFRTAMTQPANAYMTNGYCQVSSQNSAKFAQVGFSKFYNTYTCPMGPASSKGKGSPTKNNLAFDLYVKFYEPEGGKDWVFKWGPDVTNGYIVTNDNGIASQDLVKHGDGLWWRGDWKHSSVRNLKMSNLAAGWHTFHIIGGEKCCDGPQSLLVCRGSCNSFSNFKPVTVANLKTICQYQPPCKKTDMCQCKTTPASCGAMKGCAWVPDLANGAAGCFAAGKYTCTCKEGRSSRFGAKCQTKSTSSEQTSFGPTEAKWTYEHEFGSVDSCKKVSTPKAGTLECEAPNDADPSITCKWECIPN